MARVYYLKSSFLQLGMLEVAPRLFLGSEGDALAVLTRVPSITKQCTVTHILTISNEPLDLSELDAVHVESSCEGESRDPEAEGGEAKDVEDGVGGDPTSCNGSGPMEGDDVKTNGDHVTTDAQGSVGSDCGDFLIREHNGGVKGGSVQMKPSKKISVKFVRLADMPESDMLHHFEPCCKFIQEALRGGGTVLVHCVHGVSRSVTMVLAYQMWSERRPFQVVYDELKKKKPEIRPNPGFTEQLKLWGVMRCRYDDSNKQYKTYRLRTIAREVKDSGYTDLGGLSPDPSTNTLDSSAYYRCRKCRRLLFTEESVLPHDVGIGESAFKWQKRGKGRPQPATPKTTPTQTHPPLEHTNQTVSNSPDVSQVNEQGPTPQTNGVTPNELAKVRAQVAMVMSQSVSDGRCSSWFVEPVEWMESALLGTVEGKVLCPKCSARLGSFNWSGEQCSCGQWVTPSFQIHKSRVDETRTLSKRKAVKTNM